MLNQEKLHPYTASDMGWSIKKTLKNCGTGSGGFQAGNNCAVGQSVDSVPSLADLKIVRGLGGTTGATLAVDSSGGKWVVKYGATAGQIRSESAANDMYRAAGVLVPLNRLDISNAQEPAQITKFVDGNKLGYPNAQDFEKNAISVSKNFAMDALLANWDAIGMENGENIVVGSNGSVTRIDNGGSLKYRAQGGVKIFGAQVGELETMRTSTQGEAVFGRLSDSDVAKQINALLTKRVKIIDAAPKELRIVISDRMDYMERWASKISTKKTSFGFLVSVLKNCGTGSGGFQAGNTCATGGGESIVSDIKLGANERFINVFPIEPPAESQTKSPMEDYENQADFMRHEYVYYGGKVPSTLDNSTKGGLGDAIACYVGTDYNKIIVAGLTVDENGNVPIRLVRRYPTSLTDMETDYAIGSAGVGDEHDQRMLVIASSIDGNRDHIGGYGESKNTFQQVMNKSGLIQHDELEESTFQETLKEVGTVGSLTKTDPSQFVVFVGSTHGNEKGELFMQDKQWDSYVNNRERIYAQSYANTLAKLHGNLSTEIEKCGLSPLGQRQSLYRGSSIPTSSVDAVIGKMVKDGVSTKSITSWSKDTTVAMNFTENGKGLVPVIFVSTKVKSGFDVNYGNQRRISSNLADAEHEIILPPQNLKVTKIERVLKGSDIVGLVIHTQPSNVTPKKSLKNCGTGSGGFQAGNTCATGGDNSNQGSSVEFVETVRPMDTYTVREEIKERYQKNSCPENYPCETEFNKNFEDDSLSEKAQALLRAYGDESYRQISNGGRALGYTNDFNDGTLEALGECCLPKDPSRYIDDFVKLIEKDPLKYFPNFATDSIFDHDWQQEFYDKATELANVVFNKAANKAHDIINKELQGLEIDTQGNNLYRGFNLDTNEAEEFVKGLKDGVLETETIQSWSKDSDRAMEFAAAGTVQAPVLLIAKGVVRGVDLNQSGWATETHEEEVVLPSNNYKVNKVTVHRNENKKIIGLEIEVNQSE